MVLGNVTELEVILLFQKVECKLRCLSLCNVLGVILLFEKVECKLRCLFLRNALGVILLFQKVECKLQIILANTFSLHCLFFT